LIHLPASKKIALPTQKCLVTSEFILTFVPQNAIFLLLTIKLSKRMHLNSEEKVEIFEKYGKGKTDTGSPEAQIALFSVRIAHLTEHLKSNHKDYTTARALKMLVGKRRRLLDYLIKKDINRYRAIIAQKELGIRK
jgi:small subunit ribosomal protein S15